MDSAPNTIGATIANTRRIMITEDTIFLVLLLLKFIMIPSPL